MFVGVTLQGKSKLEIWAVCQFREVFGETFWGSWGKITQSNGVFLAKHIEIFIVIISEVS